MAIATRLLFTFKNAAKAALCAGLAIGLSEAGSGQTFSEYSLSSPPPGCIADAGNQPSALPTSIVAGPDGAMWFVESCVGKIARITVSGVITEFNAPIYGARNAHGIAVGPDGALWFAGSDTTIGRITAAGLITQFPIPQGQGYPVQDPSIAIGPDNAIWFGDFQDPSIARLTTDGVFTVFPLPGEYGSGVYGAIVLGPDGALWFASGLGSITRMTTSGATTRLPAANGPLDMVLGPDGALWFSGANSIGRVTTAGDMSYFAVDPTFWGSPLTVGADHAIWFNGGNTNNRLGRLTTAGEVTQYFIPTPFSSPLGIASAPDGSIWFTEYAGNKIGRFAFTTCVAGGERLCLSDARFGVTALWTKPDGSSGAGRAVSLTPDTGYFWFFSPSNVEVVVKVLNGCAVDSRQWVFAGGLTDVRVTMTVTDTKNGATKTYENPQSTAFRAIQDTAAFAACP